MTENEIKKWFNEWYEGKANMSKDAIWGISQLEMLKDFDELKDIEANKWCMNRMLACIQYLDSGQADVFIKAYNRLFSNEDYNTELNDLRKQNKRLIENVKSLKQIIDGIQNNKPGYK